jgi:histidine phosphotransferase ChpT
MASHTRTIATLIGSRICHDLISPIGAIQNGIELLTMEGKTGPEIALIEDSVRNASARIRFMRVAFGMAGGGQTMGRAEITSILADLGQSGRVQFDWQPTEDCVRTAVQEVFLALMCLETAMPRGGPITISKVDGAWAISGMAEKNRPDARLWDILCGADPGGDAVLPAHVQFTLLPEILNDRGVRAEVASDPDLMTIRFPA